MKNSTVKGGHDSFWLGGHLYHAHLPIQLLFFPFHSFFLSLKPFFNMLNLPATCSSSFSCNLFGLSRVLFFPYLTCIQCLSPEQQSLPTYLHSPVNYVSKLWIKNKDCLNCHGIHKTMHNTLNKFLVSILPITTLDRGKFHLDFHH